MIWREFIIEYNRFILTLKRNENEMFTPTIALTCSSEGNMEVSCIVFSFIWGGKREVIEKPSGIGAFSFSIGNMNKLVFQKEIFMESYRSP